MPTTPTSKPWYTSIAIWGSLIAGFTMVIQTITSTLDGSVGTHLATNPIVMGIIAILGSIMAIIGRFNAILPIGTPSVPTAAPASGPTTTTVTRTVVTTDPAPVTTTTTDPATPAPTTMNKIS